MVGCGTTDVAAGDSGPTSFPRATGNVVRLPLADFPALSEADGWVRGIPPNLAVGAIVIHVGTGNAATDYVALHAACTHMDCGVNYDPVERRLECPCHGSLFALTGDVLHGPATDPLTALAVAVDSVAVEITIT